MKNTSTESNKLKMSHNVHTAPYGFHGLFLEPIYRRKDIVPETEDREVTYVQFWSIDKATGKRQCESGYTHINLDLFEDFTHDVGFDSYYVEFLELTTGEWVVAFKSQTILASRYLRLSPKNMIQVLNRRVGFC